MTFTFGAFESFARSRTCHLALLALLGGVSLWSSYAQAACTRGTPHCYRDDKYGEWEAWTFTSLADFKKATLEPSATACAKGEILYMCVPPGQTPRSKGGTRYQPTQANVSPAPPPAPAPASAQPPAPPAPAAATVAPPVAAAPPQPATPASSPDSASTVSSQAPAQASTQTPAATSPAPAAASGGPGSTASNSGGYRPSRDNVGGDGGTTNAKAYGSGEEATKTVYFKDGGTVSLSGSGLDEEGNPDPNVKSMDVKLGDASSKFDRSAVGESGDSDCQVSSGVSGNYSCKGTKILIEGGKITNALGQATGSVATAAVGQGNQQAAMAAGTQSAALHAAASTQRTSGYIQVGAGAVNVVAGALQLQRHIAHNGNESEFHGAARASKDLQVAQGLKDEGTLQGQSGYVSSNDNKLANKIIAETDAGDMNARGRKLIDATAGGKCTSGQGDPDKCRAYKAYRDKQIEDKKATIQADVRSIAHKAAGEQNAMAQQALAGGMMSMITGISQATSGAFSIAAANQLDQAAKNLAAAENMVPPVPGFQPLGPGNLLPGDPVAPGNGNSLNPSTQGPVTDPATTDNTPSDLGTLGTPIGSPQDTKPEAGPAPGAFSPGNPPTAGGPGGGAGSGLGGLSTSPSTPDQGDPQAKMADAGRGAGYDSGGGTFGSGGGGGVAAERGPDLSGLLAQFLPKDKDDKPGKNILDFGARNPAAEGPISLLDRNANIFERIHETYQDKNRRGRVGL